MTGSITEQSLLLGKGVKVLQGAYRGIAADTLEDLEACSKRGKPRRQTEEAGLRGQRYG